MMALESKNGKILESKDYNFIFNKTDGFFARWGKDKNDDPKFSPFGPEIADIEITTICEGIGDKGPCPFCYKSNTSKGKYMTFDKFKGLFSILPKETLTQIAFGVDAKCESNPDTFKILKYCRDNGIIPNITIADISEETADKLSMLCGAVSVSRYENKKYCYNSVKKLTDRGMKQVNIHQLLSKETLSQVYETINDIRNDSRLVGLNAIVFLSLKKKGRGKGYTPVSKEEFNNLITHTLESGINFGMDSCSATKMLGYIKDKPTLKNISNYIEPCESLCFSSYFNVYGEFFPCSFVEGEGEWKEGVHYSKIDNFLNDLWFTKKSKDFRIKLLEKERSCPIFKI